VSQPRKNQTAQEVAEALAERRLDDFKKRLLEPEVIAACEKTSSRRHLRGREETERYKRRIAEVIGTAIRAAEESE